MNGRSKLLAPKLFTPDEIQAIEASFDSILSEYQSNNKMTLNCVTIAFGNPPEVPQSPDMDERMEYWSAIAEYSKKVNNLEALIKCELHL